MCFLQDKHQKSNFPFVWVIALISHFFSFQHEQYSRTAQSSRRVGEVLTEAVLDVL